VLVLLVLSMFLNYLDRGSLSVAAPMLVRELRIGPTEMGLLFSAFFWTYAVCQVGSGWLVDRVRRVKWVYAAGFLVWSLATMATGFVGGFGALFACRLLLGLGESVAYPACSRILVRSVPESRRGLANAWIDAGTKAGPALSNLVGGLIVAEYGWRWLFFGAGVVSLLWLPAWIGLFREEDGVRAGGGEEVSFGRILSRREAWGTSLAMFALGYVWYFLLSWLPTYLVRARGLSMQQVATYGSLPLAMMGLATVGWAWLADRRTAAHGPNERRRFLVVALLATAALLPPAAVVESFAASMVLLVAAHVALAMFAANVWAATQTLAGSAAAGRWTGFQNAVGNLGGVVSPWVAGVALDRTGSFVPAFFAAAAVAIGGAACYWWLVPRLEPLDLNGRGADYSKR
jgi:MFS family permease